MWIQWCLGCIYSHLVFCFPEFRLLNPPLLVWKLPCSPCEVSCKSLLHGPTWQVNGQVVPFHAMLYINPNPRSILSFLWERCVGNKQETTNNYHGWEDFGCGLRSLFGNVHYYKWCTQWNNTCLLQDYMVRLHLLYLSLVWCCLETFHSVWMWVGLNEKCIWVIDR